MAAVAVMQLMLTGPNIAGMTTDHSPPTRMKTYLEFSDHIDWQHPDILALARQLAGGSDDDTQIARACFHWVRDHIKHSADHRLDHTTCRASEVLQRGHGFCYAKSHLLAALLRANGIPAGLCYQRLSIDDNGAPYCLHGLNAVHLKDHGWYRIDARGNKPGVDAQFEPPRERLAFALNDENECDFPEIWARPLPVVTEVLTGFDTCRGVLDNLPDVAIIATR